MIMSLGNKSEVPQIEIELDRESRLYEPDEEITISYQLNNIDPQMIQAIEASVLWYTEGTGEEDFSTHDFRRSLPMDEEDGNLTRRKTFHSRLPRCPLSYDGVIVKLHWVVRVRVFLDRGKELMQEVSFRLGSLPAVQLAKDDPPTEKSTTKNSDSD